MARCANPSRKAADRLLHSAVSVIALLHADAAFAADDPFELKSDPRDRPAQSGPLPGERLMVEVLINGVAKTRLVELIFETDGLYITTDQAAYLDLPLPRGATGRIALSSISGIRFTYDARRVRLDIEKLRAADGPNLVDMKRSNRQGDGGLPLTALVIDYNGIARVDDRGFAASMLTNMRLSRENLSLESGWQVNTRPGTGIGHVTRLDTSLTVIDDKRGLKAVLGDFVAPGSLNRAVRMAGFQIGTDFSTRPDLITYPLPELGGSVGLPSGLDILVNDRRISSAPVQAGEYAIRNVPVPIGRNSVGVVIKNALGVEEVRSVQFYTSASMLAPGLSQTQFSLGFIRRRYGFASNDYGKLAFSGRYRRGLSERLTGEASVEVARHFYNLGVNAVVSLGDVAAVKAGISRSSLSPTGVKPRQGTMLTFGVESLGSPVSATIEARHASAGYDDLASASGDPSPFSRISASLNFDLRKFGQLQVSGIRQYRNRFDLVGNRYRSDRSNFVGVSYRTTLAKRVDIYADFAVDPARRNSASVLLGLSLRFGSRTMIQSSAVRQNGQIDAQFGAYRPDVLPGDIGYQVSGGTGAVDRLSGGLSYRGTWGRVEARAESVGANRVASIGAQGAFVIAKGAVIAANRIGEAFALVRTGGIGNIHVLRDNRLVGVSNKAGLLLVTDIPAFVPVKISVGAESVPVGAVVRKESGLVKAGARSGRLIELPVEAVVPATIQIIDFDKQPLRPGTMITALPSKSEVLVGFDGIVEFNQSLGDVEFEYRDAQGSRCFAEIPATLQIEPFAYLGTAACTQRIRSVDIAAMGIKTPVKVRKLRDQKRPMRPSSRNEKALPPKIKALMPLPKTSVLARELRLFGT